jgi:hypothetical protein
MILISSELPEPEQQDENVDVIEDEVVDADSSVGNVMDYGEIDAYDSDSEPAKYDNVKKTSSRGKHLITLSYMVFNLAKFPIFYAALRRHIVSALSVCPSIRTCLVNDSHPKLQEGFH